MSRLYSKIKTDTRKTLNTTGGNGEIESAIYYGSANDSKLAVSTQVIYPKGNDKPYVLIIAGEGIDVKVV